MIKRLFLLCICLWATARFCHHQTEGFRLSKLVGSYSLHHSSFPMTKEVETLLQQKFHYLGRGLQSFAFASEDGDVVLKLFNNRYQRRLFWLKFFPNQEKKLYNEKKLQMTFDSYLLSFFHFKEACGLYFLHLKKSSDCPTVTIVDKLGIEHKLNLSNVGFALQKKATLPYPYLSNCKDRGDLEGAKEAILAIMGHIKKKMELGLGDRDPLIRTNLGFCGGKVMQIDIGPLFWDSSLKNPSSQKEEASKITLSLKHWIENHYPELVPTYEEALHCF